MCEAFESTEVLATVRGEVLVSVPPPQRNDPPPSAEALAITRVPFAKLGVPVSELTEESIIVLTPSLVKFPLTVPANSVRGLETLTVLSPVSTRNTRVVEALPLKNIPRLPLSVTLPSPLANCRVELPVTLILAADGDPGAGPRHPS